MCIHQYAIHNLYSKMHDISRFNCVYLSPNNLKYNCRHYYEGTLMSFIDIETIFIRLNFICYKKVKLADINIPPYIEGKVYLDIIDYFEDMLKNKKVQIVTIEKDYIYMYYNKQSINTMINNYIIQKCNIINKN